jgi:hypothetical protein
MIVHDWRAGLKRSNVNHFSDAVLKVLLQVTSDFSPRGLLQPAIFVFYRYRLSHCIQRFVKSIVRAEYDS